MLLKKNDSLKNTTPLLVFLILILTFFCFIPALQGDFVNWDDDKYVLNNILIRELSWKNIRNIFLTLPGNRLYVPLATLSHAIEYHFVGFRPFLYHLNNVLLHLLNTFLVYSLIYYLSRRKDLSLFVMVLFGIHPIHVESVAWITERKDVLYSCFYLGALVSYCTYLASPASARRWYYLTLVLFIGSLFSKPAAVTLPAILILCDYSFNRNFKNVFVWIEKVPFFIISFFIVWVLLSFSTQSWPSTFYIQQPLIVKIAFICYMFLGYIKNLVFPFNLSLIYPNPSFDNPLLIISPIIILSFIYLFLRRGKFERAIVFAGGFFVIHLGLIFYQNLFNQFGMNDRYLYLASIGVFYALGIFVLAPQRKGSRMFRHGILLSIGILCVVTTQRCTVWQNSIRLWTDLIDRYPNIGTAYINRGNAYRSLGRYHLAVKDYNEAIKLNQRLAFAYTNRGTIYSTLGQYDVSLRDYEQAIRINPKFFQAYIRRGEEYYYRGEDRRALADLDQAIKLDPHNAVAYKHRGDLWRENKLYALAISDYNKALDIDPYYLHVYLRRAQTYRLMNNIEHAYRDYKTALELDPDNKEVKKKLKELEYEGRTDD